MVFSKRASQTRSPATETQQWPHQTRQPVRSRRVSFGVGLPPQMKPTLTELAAAVDRAQAQLDAAKTALRAALDDDAPRPPRISTPRKPATKRVSSGKPVDLDTEELKAKIVELNSQKMTDGAISRMLKVSYRTIGRLRKGMSLPGYGGRPRREMRDAEAMAVVAAKKGLKPVPYHTKARSKKRPGPDAEPASQPAPVRPASVTAVAPAVREQTATRSLRD